jgi:hypothetical protein
MEDRKPLSKMVVRFRRRLLIGMIPLCLFVAGYCMIAGMASGGSHSNREGEISYSAPVQHSREFYTGLRWSVMIVGAIMAITSYCWKHQMASGVFGLVAVLFNPIIAIQIPKEAWQSIDILVFLIFFVGPGYLWPKAVD